MTGEICLNGDVLPVGGLAGKLAAARRERLRRLVLPEGCSEELQLTAKDKKGVELRRVKTIWEAMGAMISGEAPE